MFLFLEICGMCWCEEGRVLKQIQALLTLFFVWGQRYEDFIKWDYHAFSKGRPARSHCVSLLSSCAVSTTSLGVLQQILVQARMYLFECTLRTNKWQFEWFAVFIPAIGINEGSANLFHIGPNGKYFRLCEPCKFSAVHIYMNTHILIDMYVKYKYFTKYKYFFKLTNCTKKRLQVRFYSEAIVFWPWYRYL